MSAIAMLVRAAWRRHWRASVFLAVVAGLAAGVVGASFQAAARADTSLARFRERSRIYDRIVQGCPPGVNPNDIESTAEGIRLCSNPIRHGAIAPRGERTSRASSAPPWHRRSSSRCSILPHRTTGVAFSLLEAAGTPGSPPSHGRPIVVGVA
jgi:hypothetical protein